MINISILYFHKLSKNFTSFHRIALRMVYNMVYGRGGQ